MTTTTRPRPPKHVLTGAQATALALLVEAWENDQPCAVAIGRDRPAGPAVRGPHADTLCDLGFARRSHPTGRWLLLTDHGLDHARRYL